MTSKMLVVLAWALLSGCTHFQLQQNTIGQSSTLSEIYQQQVLNNLAKFASDPHSLPDFAIPNQGSNAVQDSADAGFGTGWSHPVFDLASFDVGARRRVSQSWTLTPVSDPRKLELMRCAYQRAVSPCVFNPEQTVCGDCLKRWALFHLGSIPRAQEGETEDWAILNALEEYRLRTGHLSMQHSHGPCWLHICCEKCVPKHCRHVGRHCGTCVYVEPGYGSDQLALLTLAVLDYALNDPPQPAVKKVRYEFDERTVIEATVSMDHEITSVTRQMEQGRESTETWHLPRPAVRHAPPLPGANLLPLEQRLRAISPE